MKRIKSGGRTKGTPNKATTELREVLKELVSLEAEYLSTSLHLLPLKNRAELFAKLLPFVLPRIDTEPINQGSKIQIFTNSGEELFKLLSEDETN